MAATVDMRQLLIMLAIALGGFVVIGAIGIIIAARKMRAATRGGGAAPRPAGINSLAEAAEAALAEGLHGDVGGTLSTLRSLLLPFSGYAMGSWNGAFVHYCLRRAGLDLGSDASFLTAEGWEYWARSQGQWAEGGEGAQRGDILLLDDGRLGILLRRTEAEAVVAEGDVAGVAAALTLPLGRVRGHIRIAQISKG